MAGEAQVYARDLFAGRTVLVSGGTSGIGLGCAQAFRNLGALTRDAVLVVVPWIQDEHYAPGLYGDFWRFSPLGVRRLMEKSGLELVHLSANEQPWYPVYLFVVGSKQPAAWKGKFPEIDWTRRLGRNQYNYPGCIW